MATHLNSSQTLAAGLPVHPPEAQGPSPGFFAKNFLRSLKSPALRTVWALSNVPGGLSTQRRPCDKHEGLPEDTPCPRASAPAILNRWGQKSLRFWEEQLLWLCGPDTGLFLRRRAMASPLSWRALQAMHTAVHPGGLGAECGSPVGPRFHIHTSPQHRSAPRK